MKKLLFEFDFTIPQSVMFKPTTGITIKVIIKVSVSGEVINGNPTVKITGFTVTDRDFQFVEDNYKLYKYMGAAAMDEYKRLHNNARPIKMTAVQLAEYGIVNIHPTQKHLN